MRIGPTGPGLILGLLLLAGSHVPPAVADCPGDTIYVCGMVITTAPSYSTSGCGPLSDATGTYNLPAGMVSASSSADYSDVYASARVTAADVYQIVGPATSAPIAFAVNFVAHGRGSSYYCTSASGSATLKSGGAQQTASFAGSSCTSEGVDKTLTLPQQRDVGEPFQLIMDLLATAGSGAMASMDGSLSFSGLPPGYAITSCQGYNSNPTGAAPLSWGRLKLHYR
jgi:hypothetical protein